MTARKFCLGGALWSLRPADDCDLPGVFAPDAWALLFAEDHVDDSVAQGLSISGRRGQVWLLQKVPRRATLTLDLTDGKSKALWTRRARAAHRGLLVRSLPTRVIIVVDNTAGSQAVWSVLRAKLEFNKFKGITEFTIQGKGATLKADEPCHIILLAAAKAPNLSRLELDYLPTTLPPASQLPHLQHLSLPLGPVTPLVEDKSDRATELDDQSTPEEDQTEQMIKAREQSGQTTPPAVYKGLASYITRLTSLAVQTSSSVPSWPILFNKDNATHTLTSLTLQSKEDNLAACLTDDLLSLLLDFVPALTHLSVASVNVQSDWFRMVQWRVKDLIVTGVNTRGFNSASNAITCLPSCSTGQTRLVMKVAHLTATSSDGLPQELCSRFAHWQLSADKVYLFPAPHLPHHNHPTALHATLGQLTNLQTTETTHIKLTGWEWTHDTLRMVADAAPMLSERHVMVAVSNLTDCLIGRLLEIGSKVPRVAALGFQMGSGMYADKDWPWAELEVGTVCVDQLVRVPRVKKIVCDHMVLDLSLLKVDQGQLKERLAHITWTHQSPCRIKLTCERAPPAMRTADNLHVLLSVLRAMQHEDSSGTTVSVAGWKMGYDVMQAMVRLPRWDGVLDLSGVTTWPGREEDDEGGQTFEQDVPNGQLQPQWQPLHPGYFKARPLDLSYMQQQQQQLPQPQQPKAQPDKHTDFTQLAQYVPSSYREWRLGAIPAWALEEVCVGIEEVRAGRGLPPVEIVVPMGFGREACAGEHFVVKVM